MIDWDGDGDLDLLSGSALGGVQWAENRAGPGKPPQSQAFRSLVKAGKLPQSGQVLRDEDLTGPASSTRIWVDDIDSDGKLDLLWQEIEMESAMPDEVSPLAEIGTY